MSRYVDHEVAREGSRHRDRNDELSTTIAVKRCHRSDGTTGVVILASRLMIVLDPEDALAIADGLVDATEATERTS